MKLLDVEIRNFRLLENVTVNNSVKLHNQTTILVGKNNSGKTSFSHLFGLFLRGEGFDFNDFSIGSHLNWEKIYDKYVFVKSDQNDLEEFLITLSDEIPSIDMILTISYDENDNWSNLRHLLTSLDTDNTVKLIFTYRVEQPKLFLEDLVNTYAIKKKNENFIDCVKKIYKQHYTVNIFPYSQYEQSEKISPNDVRKFINSCFIAAQRSVEDGNSKTNSKLSPVFQKEYQKHEHRNKDFDIEEQAFKELNSSLIKANTNIDKKLKNFFKDFLDSFSTFGFPNDEGTELLLKSSVSPSNLFNSINLFYSDKEHLLPEKYNGLGYSNLIYIVSEILSFKSENDHLHTDLNLIFIEEPEAHMHPQLQSTFILKLNKFLEKNNINSQVIITTHSPHIVSNAQFEGIRYFSKQDKNIIVKDLMKFKPKQPDGAEEDTIEFLKQYITLVKCDMFFADKIILIEGTTERLLMPLFIEKIDKKLKKNIRPLSEQYISLIEIGGAYMLKFKDFLDFLNIKTLIITDIDSCNEENREKSEITKGNLKELITSNQTLIKWYPKKEKISDLIFEKEPIESNNMICITYQKNYYEGKTKIKCGRSFEEAFIIENHKYIFNNQSKLISIKNNVKNYKIPKEVLNNSYSIYDYISRNNKKTVFAFDLMNMNSFDWKVPAYIKEGLEWLAK